MKQGREPKLRRFVSSEAHITTPSITVLISDVIGQIAVIEECVKTYLLSTEVMTTEIEETLEDAANELLDLHNLVRGVRLRVLQAGRH